MPRERVGGLLYFELLQQMRNYESGSLRDGAITLYTKAATRYAKGLGQTSGRAGYDFSSLATSLHGGCENDTIIS